MNVYSIRLIPSLKLKFCEFLGIASAVAMDQLADRVGSLEQKMGQLDEKLKRNGGRLMDTPMKVLASRIPKIKKRPSPTAKAKMLPPKPVDHASPPPAEKRKTTRRVRPMGAPAGESSPPANLVALAQPEASSEAPVRAPAVILVKQDDATQQTMRKYFGGAAEILQTERLPEVEEILEGREALAVFFDRTLLGQTTDREWLEGLSVRYPGTAMVGLSSYLTLAIAEAVPPEDDWLTFLTKPLTENNLEGILGGKEQAAIS